MYLPLPAQTPSPYDINFSPDIWSLPINPQIEELANVYPLTTTDIYALAEPERKITNEVLNKKDAFVHSDSPITPSNNKTEDLGNTYASLSTDINVTEKEEAKIESNVSNETDKIINTDDIAQKLKALLLQAGVPSIDENLLLKGLMANNNNLDQSKDAITISDKKPNEKLKVDLGQSENDFINAYNALTRQSPLPNIDNSTEPNNNVAQNINQEINANIAPVVENEMDVTIPTLNSYTTNSTTPRFEGALETLQILSVEHEQNINDEASLLADLKESVNAPIHLETPDTVLQRNVIPNIDNEKTELEQLGSNSTTPLSIKNNNIHLPPKEQNSRESPKNILQQDHVVKDSDKSSNLNDIVDNTQKLIQQMKAEINSDINSLDDSHTSESEADNSSNESDLSTEHESTYSESEEETENLTTENKDYTSSEDEDPKHAAESITHLGRTSSEENEQFEEAMDHLEEQTEAIQQTNFEMLDSIARSLQEEHTISLELESQQLKKPNRSKRQDVNNNFATVNTFEEIYEELNVDQPSLTENLTQKSVVAHLPQLDKTSLIKENIDLIVFKPEPASVVIISEIVPTTHNADLKTVDASLGNEILPLTINATVENSEESLVTQDDYLDTVNTVELNIKESSDEENDNVDNVGAVLNNSENIDASTIEKDDISILQQKNVPKAVAEADDSNIFPITEIVQENRDISEVISQDENTTHDFENENSNINTEGIRIEPESSSSTSFEKTSSSPSRDTNNEKNIVATKSNIPKLVKVLPSIKQKVDKIAPKVLASKVPVRRGSLKQNPAPEPPKSHFGNIRSGHVKQLQTRLFNPKTSKAPAPPVPVEVKASTSSTLNKKKPAPPPPKDQNKEPSVTPTPKQKNEQFFRETCRTEDEWTESDSEDSQLQIVSKPEAEPERSPPSPPPPPTLRRVSGVLIDLARIRLPEGSPEVNSPCSDTIHASV